MKRRKLRAPLTPLNLYVQERRTEDSEKLKCLKCGRVLDGATSINRDRTPRPGSIVVCVHCGQLMSFQEDLSFEAITLEWLEQQTDCDPDARKAVTIVSKEAAKRYKRRQN